MEAKLVEINHITDERGTLNFVEVTRQLFFPIQNVFFIHDVPKGASRGNHANKRSHELIVALKGSVRITLNKQDEYLLNRNTVGLIVPARHWIEMKDFSEDALCLSLSSEPYSEEEKMTDFSQLHHIL